MYKSFTSYLKERNRKKWDYYTFVGYVTFCIKNGFECFHYYDILLSDETLGQAYDELNKRMAAGDFEV